MPNWCSNSIQIEGTKEQIKTLVSFLDENNGKDWFDFFRPCPQELKDIGNVSMHEPGDEKLLEKYGHSDWYSWSIENWGTKWNCDAQDWMTVENPTEDVASVTFWFDSAWAPPIALYEYIELNSPLIIKASYNECGMGFVGEFVDGSDDYYEYSDMDDLENIPEHLVEEWNLVEMLEMDEEDDDE